MKLFVNVAIDTYAFDPLDVAGPGTEAESTEDMNLALVRRNTTARWPSDKSCAGKNRGQQNGDQIFINSRIYRHIKAPVWAGGTGQLVV